MARRVKAAAASSTAAETPSAAEWFTLAPPAWKMYYGGWQWKSIIGLYQVDDRWPGTATYRRSTGDVDHIVKLRGSDTEEAKAACWEHFLERISPAIQRVTTMKDCRE